MSSAATNGVKHFTDADVQRDAIQCDRSELVYAPTTWMKLGLQETATGYGKRLNSGLKIHFNGRLYRIYITCFSNAGTAWFVAKGRRIVVHA